MKFKKILAIASITPFVIFGSLAIAKPAFQAGDIAEGGAYEISKKSGAASYYKEGSEGSVTFACSLISQNDEKVRATLIPGKNFTVNKPAVLNEGWNGPFTWKLHYLGADNGNIKVSLIQGDSAMVRCKQLQ